MEWWPFFNEAPWQRQTRTRVRQKLTDLAQFQSQSQSKSQLGIRSARLGKAAENFIAFWVTLFFWWQENQFNGLLLHTYVHTLILPHVCIIWHDLAHDNWQRTHFTHRVPPFGTFRTMCETLKIRCAFSVWFSQFSPLYVRDRMGAHFIYTPVETQRSHPKYRKSVYFYMAKSTHT